MAGTETILAEGAVIERLLRDPEIKIDPHILHAAFIYEDNLRDVLTQIYREYIDAARDAGLPIIIQAPTWRASEDRVRASGHADLDAINRDGVTFMDTVRARYGDFAKRIYIGGLLSCRGDAYKPQESLRPEEATAYHRPQAAALAGSGADFLLAATLPAVAEALGMARAMAAHACPYLLSFVLRPTGTLLDGTPLSQAIRTIDCETERPPDSYLINCAHPSTMITAWDNLAAEEPPARLDRVIGLQANTSAQPPEELDGRDSVAGADPAQFAQELLAAGRRCRLRILGGCCGTDRRHIRALAHLIRQNRSS